MASLPEKWLYDRAKNALIDSDGAEIQKDTAFPGIAIGQQYRVNLQVYDGYNTKYTGFGASTSFDILADSEDFTPPPPLLGLYGDGSGSWENTTGSEYKYIAENISEKPQLVQFDGSDATEGTVGSLSEGEWGWDSDNNDLHVRLGDSSDPDTKAHSYVAQQPPGSGIQPFILVDASTIQESGTWYDEDSGTYRDPDVTKGEVSFLVDAARVRFYEKLNERMHVWLKFWVLAIGSDGFVEQNYSWRFHARNRMRSVLDPISLDISLYPYWSRSEADARYVQGEGTNKIVVSETEPSSPATGTLWIDPSA